MKFGLLDTIVTFVGLLCAMSGCFSFGLMVYLQGHHTEAWLLGGVMFYAIVRVCYYIDELHLKLREVPTPEPVMVDVDGVMSHFEERFKEIK